MAIIYFGDQFINFIRNADRKPDAMRHFGIAVDDKPLVRKTLESMGVKTDRQPFPRFPGSLGQPGRDHDLRQHPVHEDRPRAPRDGTRPPEEVGRGAGGAARQGHGARLTCMGLPSSIRSRARGDRGPRLRAAASCNTAEVARRGPGYKYYVVGNPDRRRPADARPLGRPGRRRRRRPELRPHGRIRRRRRLRRAARVRQATSTTTTSIALCRCDSVETIVFDKGAATADPFVIETIRNAEAVWIAGGDQSNYIRYWKDTPVEDAINFVAAKPAPVGGTSAGMAVLGEYVYSAEGKESLTSASPSRNPYAPDLTLARDFLVAAAVREHPDRPAPAGARPDRSHRRPALAAAEGRLVVAAARHRGRSRDRRCTSTRWTALPRFSRPPTIRRLTSISCTSARAAAACERVQPLTPAPIAVYRLGPGGRFDLARWQGSGGIDYELSVRDGVLQSSRERTTDPPRWQNADSCYTLMRA